MLGVGLVEFEAGMRKCLVAPDTLPAKTYVSLLSISYNIGTGAFCKSTIVRNVNAGDLRWACEGFKMWAKAKGKTIPGLVRRRAEGQALCLADL